MESEAAATSWTEEYNSYCRFVALMFYYLSTKQSIYSFLGNMFRTTPNQRIVFSYAISPLNFDHMAICFCFVIIDMVNIMVFLEMLQ